MPTLLQAQVVDTLAYSVDLDDVVVTAQYVPTEARNAVHRITVIDRGEWQQRGILNLSELLQRQLAFTVTPDPILGNGLAIQGLGGQNVQIMVDGVPVIGRLGGEIDLTQLDLTRYARVEIVSGALSARYGTDAAGGVVNLITAREQEREWRVSAGAHYESIDLDRAHFRVGRKFGRFQIDGGVSRYRARFGPVDSLRSGVVPWNPKEQLGYDAALAYRPHDSLLLTYGYRAFEENLTLYGPVRRPTYRPYVQDQQFDTHREDHALSGRWHLSPVVVADLTAGWNAFSRYKRTERGDLEADTSSLEPGGQDTTRYTGQLLRMSVATARKKTFAGQIGIEYRRESGAGGRILDAGTGEHQPALVNAAAWLGLTFRHRRHWTVEATTRLGHNNRYHHPVVPALHVLWKPGENWRYRAGYAAGFRAPAIQELFFNFIDVNHHITGNPSLDAERSHNFRLSADWNHPSAISLSVSGEAFYNRLRDRITLADVAEGRFSYVNLSEYETHGLTLQSDYSPLPGLDLNVGGAITRLLNEAGAASESAPRYTTLAETRTEVSYRVDKLGIGLRADHRYVGRRDRYQVAADGTVSRGFVGDYHLLHLTARKALWRNRLTLTAGVKNLLNRDRVPVTGGSGTGAHSGGGGGQLIDFGRSFFVGLAMEW